MARPLAGSSITPRRDVRRTWAKVYPSVGRVPGLGTSDPWGSSLGSGVMGTAFLGAVRQCPPSLFPGDHPPLELREPL